MSNEVLQTSFKENVKGVMGLDPKLLECRVSLERINISEEVKRLKNSMQEKDFEHRHKRIKISVEDEDGDDQPEMGCETSKTTFLKATPKKIISIKGIGRITLPKKARLIYKLDTAKGPLIIIDRKRPDIRLERLKIPNDVLEETCRYYKERETKEESIFEVSDSTQREITAKVEPRTSSKQVSSTKNETNSGHKMKAKIKRPVLQNKLSGHEVQIANVANFLGGHWFADLQSGPSATYQNIVKASEIHKTLFLNQNQGPENKSIQALPGMQPGMFISNLPPGSMATHGNIVTPSQFQRAPFLDQNQGPQNRSTYAVQGAQSGMYMSNLPSGSMATHGNIVTTSQFQRAPFLNQNQCPQNRSTSAVPRMQSGMYMSNMPPGSMATHGNILTASQFQRAPFLNQNQGPQNRSTSAVPGMQSGMFMSNLPPGSMATHGNIITTSQFQRAPIFNQNLQPENRNTYAVQGMQSGMYMSNLPPGSMATHGNIVTPSQFQRAPFLDQNQGPQNRSPYAVQGAQSGMYMSNMPPGSMATHGNIVTPSQFQRAPFLNQNQGPQNRSTFPVQGVQSGMFRGNLPSGSMATHGNIVTASQLQRAPFLNQNQGPQNRSTSAFPGPQLVNIGISAAAPVQEPQNQANGIAGPSHVREAIVQGNGFANGASQNQGPQPDNSIRSDIMKQLQCRIYFVQEGDQNVKKIFCPICKVPGRFDEFKDHMATIHQKILPGEVSRDQGANRSSNVQNGNSRPITVKCKYCDMSILKKDILNHGCILARLPEALALKKAKMLNDTIPYSSSISVPSCFRLRVWPHYKTTGPKQPSQPKDGEVTCQICFVDIPKESLSGHKCKLFCGSGLDDRRAFFKCPKCNDYRLYSPADLKKHHNDFHKN